MATVVIGLGSNLNQPLQQLRTAVKKLSTDPDLSIEGYSAIYRSQSLLAGQPDYLNAALRLHTTLSPRDLLVRLKKIEVEMGRTPAEKWAARVIDLDILCYDQLQLDEPDLKIPHPELHKRAFALTPLLDVWPDYPILKSKDNGPLAD